ncbi:MAG TPA: lytic transglycosylase domain-containing protein [Pseudolabrys sp.]|nr:lytic transglycosylase domain-containing protein [Pseudolabrys sp.]
MPLPRKRPIPGAAAVSAYAQATIGLRGGLFTARATFKPLVRPTSGPFAIASTPSTSESDIASVKRVIELTRKGKEADANSEQAAIKDPVARKLAEWMILRSDNTNPPFKRYADFIAANPAWPHVPLFRRRAENALWNDKIDDATVRAFFASHAPTTAKGRFVLARAKLAQGDKAGAEALVRYAWRKEDFSAEVESKVLEMFGEMITREDQKARMDERLYADDVEAALRCAHRLGGNELAIAKAWAAVIRKSSNAKALLDAVPASARHEAGYIFSRVHWLRKHDKLSEAATLMLSAPRDPNVLYNLDQWWQERRILVRKLLDDHDAQSAYRIARDAATPTRDNFRVDQQFTAGWIALRYLHDPVTAAAHFAKIPEGTANPHALSRAGYWQGRAADAMGHKADAKAFYQAAAQFTATYYGQLARARLGLTELGLRGPPPLTPEEHKTLSELEIVRAVEILYKLDERDLIAPIYAELGESATDIAGMAILGETAGKHGDGRSMLLLGQAGMGRGLPLDYYAYPTVGLPDYKPIGPPIEAAVAYSIARQESHFNQKVVSIAHAMGLMQVTPAAGIDTAKKYGATYNRGRLLSDPVYNMQMGAAELGGLLKGYNGSYILTFAGYNAGRGRVKQWIAAYGDPRDPNVDPVDWVERIPLSETRNYVERIMENLQVYRARFGGGSKLLIEADIKRGEQN